MVSRWPFTADARVQSQASPWEGTEWQWDRFGSNWLGLSCQYHSTPSFMYHRRCIILATDALWVWRQYVTTYQMTLCHNRADQRMRQLPTCSDSAPRWSMFRTLWDPRNDYTGTRRTWSLRGGGACSRFPTARPCNKWTGVGLWGPAPLREWSDLRQTWSSWRSSGDSCAPA